MVAAELRERILSGAIPDGGSLPKHEDLLEEFQVSGPSIREAFRILETEGLVTVRRGNVGGAIVHVPQPSTAAYMLGLVMQAHDVGLSDVAAALQKIEPLCVSMCAARERPQAHRGSPSPRDQRGDVGGDRRPRRVPPPDAGVPP